MGKNQAYKAMQRARLGSGSGGPEEVDDGMTDGSFHSPEWHAARLASLNTSHTVTWEEFKRKQKEEAAKKGELEADKDRMMREYRAQLDAERAAKLAKGRNHSRERSHHKKEKKDKDRKKKEKDYKKISGKKRKHSRRHSDSSSSDTSSESSNSDDEERGSKRSKARSKRRKERKHKSKSRSRHSDSDSEDSNGPVPLSRFFGTVKS